MSDFERASFWERTARKHQAEAEYYQKELAKAHELLGRIIHQASERRDAIRLSKFFPTDNFNGKRTINNPTGEEVQNG